MAGQRWDVVSIREYTDGNGQPKTSWTRCGVGFTNQNGSINIQLDAIPLSGKLQLQVPLDRSQQQGNRGGGQGYNNRSPPGQPQQSRQQPRQGWGQQGNRQQQARPQGQPAPAGQVFNQQGQEAGNLFEGGDQNPPDYPPPEDDGGF